MHRLPNFGGFFCNKNVSGLLQDLEQFRALNFTTIKPHAVLNTAFPLYLHSNELIMNFIIFPDRGLNKNGGMYFIYPRQYIQQAVFSTVHLVLGNYNHGIFKLWKPLNSLKWKSLLTVTQKRRKKNNFSSAYVLLIYYSYRTDTQIFFCAMVHV